MDTPTPLDPLDANIPSRQSPAKVKIIEKSLPLSSATFDRTRSERIGASTQTNINGYPSHASGPSLARHTSFQRPKKRLIWRNKACTIALPLENEAGLTTSREDYLKPEEVAKRLEGWEEKGFDTTGFVLAPPTAESAPFIFQGQSRAAHPDPEDEKHERAERSYRVSIPNRRDWEAYVDYLKEEKLRALGVSFSDNEPPSRKSPAPSLMSRQGSSQSSAILTSPSLQASSVPPNAFGPTFQLGTLQPGKYGVSHFPRLSMTMPFEANALPHPSHFSKSQSPVHRNLSPLGYLSPRSGSTMGSPSIHEQIVNLHGSFSPAPPTDQRNTYPESMRDFDENVTQRQQHHQSLLNQEPQQHHQQLQPDQMRLQPNIGDPRYSNNTLGPTQNQLHLNIVTPIPQGHHQNPSESLQREVEELHFEGAKKDMEPEKAKMYEEKSFGQEFVKDSDSLETQQVEAVRSDIGDCTAPIASRSEPQDIRSRSQSMHRSKTPISSKLNVNAPEFKYEPKADSTPCVLPLVRNQPPSGAFPEPSRSPSNIAYTRQPSLAHQPSRFNVAAPVFKPGAAAAPKPNLPSRVFSFGTIPIANSEFNNKPGASQEFSFSSKAPVLNPDAPAFRPGERVKSIDIGRTEHDSVEEVKKIFGEFSFSDATKRMRKLKAVPIVTPREEELRSTEDSDGPEDESGRITQSDARQKRMRRDQDEGDQVPQFASPHDIPCVDNGQDKGVPYPMTSSSPPSSEAQPTTLEAATDLLEEIIDDMSASEASSLMREAPAKIHGRAGDDSEFHDIAQTSRSTRSSPRPRGNSVEYFDPTPEAVIESTQAFLGRSSQYISEFDPEARGRISRSQSPSLSLSDYGREGRAYNERSDRTAHVPQAAPLRQDVLDGVRYVEPSYRELDAVMKHLNQDGGSDVGADRSLSPWRRLNEDRSPQKSHRSGSRQLLPPVNIRSDAPSPSPNRLRESFQYLPPTDTESADSAAVRMVARNARYSPSYRPSRDSPHLHRLNSPGSTPPSDWNDAISSIDEVQLKSRTGFFDSKVNDLVGDIVQKRLTPLENALCGIQSSLTQLSERALSRTASRRPRSSGTLEALNSDADDEDEAEELSQSILKSPPRDRRYDQLKASISELAVAQRGSAPAAQITELLNAVKDLKISVSQAPRATTPASDIKHVVEEAVNRQMRGKSAPVISTTQAAAAEKSHLQIAGLESMLKIAETRADDEMKARRATEDALADNQRLLRQALQEASQQRESAEATERSLQEYHEERQHSLKHTAMLEGSQETLEKRASYLNEKNEALESTLAEYRLFHDQWRTDIDNTRHENKEAHRNIQALKAELEGGQEEKHTLRSKLSQLQESMLSASTELAADKLSWRTKEEEHRNRLDLLSARLEAEARTRERLELEIERLEAQEKESMKARFQVEQTQKANVHLDRLVGKLRSESHDHQNAAARLQRELHAAKETGIMEVHRIRSAMEVDIKAAKSEVNVVRADLRHSIVRLEKQLEDATGDASRAKSRHEVMLEEASKSRHVALQEAADARDKALQEHYRFHERTVEELKGQHQRALDDALADKQRIETSCSNRLSLADENLTHYQDKVSHLEQKLGIAKSAANAAIQAAKAKKSAVSPSASNAAMTKNSDIPEKISPQALRESILVLQEQLQAREAHIETIEAKIAVLDMDAPAKLKEADIEISWLRELLGVRIDDLQDIILTLSQPSYDREAVKDAAIRLKANLQMEEQEKERALAGGQVFPSLPNISNLTASPKALPMAAAAAWGNWRKGRDSGLSNFGTNATGMANQTPSKPSTSPQSFFAGLMTPPRTNMRNTPPLQQGAEPRPALSSSRRSFGGPTTPRQSMSLYGQNRPLRQQSLPHQEPITPPLMRRASYDLDAAEAAVFGDEGQEQYRKTDYEVGEEDEPFGPKIGTFVAS